MWFAQSLSLPSLYRYSFLCARPVYNDNGCGSILPSCSAGRTQRGAYETTLIFLSIALFSSLAVQNSIHGSSNRRFHLDYEEGPAYKETLRGCTRRTRYRDVLRRRSTPCRSFSHRRQACTRHSTIRG